MSHSNLDTGPGEKTNVNLQIGAREALLRNVADLRDFVENAPEGFRRVRPDGLILWANRAELEMLGFTREEYVGRHLAEFHTDAEIVVDYLARLARGERLRDHEARMVCKDGSIRHVLINSSALFENGKFIHTRCCTRDITERKRAEDKLNSAFERESAIRAVAQASSRSKDEFISLALQALRAPLNAIVGYNRLLRENPPDASRLKQSCEVIERNVLAQLQTLEEMLHPSCASKFATERKLMFGPRPNAAQESSGEAVRAPA